MIVEDHDISDCLATYGYKLRPDREASSFVLALWHPATCRFESSSFFSQAFEDRHFTEREIFFGMLNELRRSWSVESGLGW